MRSFIPFILVPSAICFTADPGLRSHNSRPLFAVDPASGQPTTAISDVQRRNILSSILVAAAGITSVTADTSTIFSSTFGSSNQMTVDDAVEVIESSCDRRFLHAVVASDYQLMYRKELSSRGKIMTINDSPMDLLDGADSEIWKSLENELVDRPIQPSNSRLASSVVVPGMESSSSGMVSVWPLGDNVHYAWPEEGHTFQENAGNKVIVDGVDCGRMSLEDALESEKDILFRSQSYLIVPPSMEKELIAKLKGAFII